MKTYNLDHGHDILAELQLSSEGAWLQQNMQNRIGHWHNLNSHFLLAIVFH